MKDTNRMPESANIIVVGSLNTDLVVRTPRRPLIGETITGAEYSEVGGGKGANQALAAARLGAQVRMIGHVGRDAYGKLVTESLASGGVDVSNVRAIEGARTAVAFIVVESEGENSIIVASGANQLWSEEDISRTEALLDQAPEGTIVMLQLEIPIEVVSRALARAKDRGHRIILDPAPVKPMPADLLEGIDYATPNELEASQITKIEVRGVKTAIDAGKVLLDRGVRTAIITLGGKGCVIATKEATQHYPTYPVNPVDTTAAGDAFNGAFAVALGKGKSCEEAAAFANAAAALATTKLGAQPSLPSREEVDEFLRRIARSSEANAKSEAGRSKGQ